MDIEKISAIARSVRSLSIDAIEKSNSGHPGLPLGSADIGATLFGNNLNINPEEPNWINRDRFILSAGHGSMLLYSLLHLSGFDISIDDLKNFRQLNSKTPGHPEYKHTPGVEATTGPLGQGVANAVGLAIAEQRLAETFNTKTNTIINNYTFALVGDGCLMEGISYEAASLAGHLGLGKLILLYDSNNITIEGSTDLAFTENVLDRFKALGWETLKGDGHNIKEIDTLIKKAKKETNKPTIIEFKTTIGKGSPLENTSTIHGTPLGPENTQLTKKTLNIPLNSSFFTDPSAVEYFENKKKEWKENYNIWLNSFNSWAEENTELKLLWDKTFSTEYNFSRVNFPTNSKISTRKAFGMVLNSAAKDIPALFGGSADLSPSTNTDLKGMDNFSQNNRLGRNINFGIREHAMGGIMNGLSLYGGIIPFGSTFLVFSDYIKPSIRLSALMQTKTLYIFTHDSFYVGEDGPTHQPIEQIEALRGIPNLRVIRPADGDECNTAMEMALEYNGPTAIILSRQDLNTFEKPENFSKNYKRGGYCANNIPDPEITLLATGSEVNKALEVCKSSHKKIRVISISDRELFKKQDTEFVKNLIAPNTTVYTLEAGINYGWSSLSSSPNNAIGINKFGYSGKATEVEKELKFNTEDIVKLII
ncbi:MAG: transketolase [Spirochaetales bacterium]|nr:transketolase [Spirochaetales bacterium]